jgi:hypothetical protein
MTPSTPGKRIDLHVHAQLVEAVPVFIGRLLADGVAGPARRLNGAACSSVDVVIDPTMG